MSRANIDRDILAETMRTITVIITAQAGKSKRVNGPRKEEVLKTTASTKLATSSALNCTVRNKLKIITS